MSEITVTMPLSHYEELKTKAKARDVSNFIKREYSDFQTNVYALKIDKEAIKKEFKLDIGEDICIFGK